MAEGRSESWWTRECAYYPIMEAGSSGVLVGFIEGVFGEWAIPTYIRGTLDEMVKEDVEKVTREIQAESTSEGFAFELGRYGAGISTVGAYGAAMCSNVADALSGEGSLNYWHIPVLATNALSIAHELLRHNQTYQIWLLRRKKTLASFL